jgi:TnpA family transposase
LEFDGPDITKRWTLTPADQMVKYTTALRLGTAETEAILRRFTRNNVQHPTYKGLAELGKAIKTIFYATIFIAKHCAARSTKG